MLVDVVSLRHLGAKVDAADVRATQPVRGVLRVSTSRVGWYPGMKNPPLIALLLSEGEPAQMLAPLDSCRVTKVDRGSMLIAGTQRYTQHGRDIRDRPVIQPRTVPLSGRG